MDKYLTGVFLSLATFSFTWVQAQQPDPSIGRNIPGSIPSAPPSSVVSVDNTLDEPAVFPVGRVVGRAGSSRLKSIEFTSGKSARSASLIEENPEWVSTLNTEALGQPLTDALAQQVARATLDLYFGANRPFVYIQIAEADYRSGKLRILVVEGVAGEVTVTDSRWFNEGWIKKQIRLTRGEPINRLRLLNDVAWIAQNPFITEVEPVFSAGKEPASTDLTLQVKDKFPLRVFGGIDNTGDDQTGEWRWNLGANWGNLFGIGHQISYQFSAPIQDLNAQPVHAMSYVAPLPWHHTASIYGSYSQSQFDIATGAGPRVTYEGYQWSISPRYTIPVGTLFGNTQQEFTLGMDWKRSDLGFTQGGAQVPTNQSDVVQFVAGYNISHRDSFLGGGITTASVDVYISPGGIGNRNTTTQFRKIDPRLDASYIYSVISAGRTQRLPHDMTLVLQATGQVAGSALISSEQLAIGGYGTVRGYEERILFGDQGVVLNGEIHSPMIPLPDFGSIQPRLQALGFCDFGLVSSKDPLPGDKSAYSICGIGFGVRCELGQYLNVRCDLGFPLVDPNIGVDIAPRVSFGTTVAF